MPELILTTFDWVPELAGRKWLAGASCVADILMADVLRLVDRFDRLARHPACRDYVARHGPAALF